MSEEMRTFGYLCPQCGRTVMAARSVFALEASNAEVECPCGKSALKVDFDGEKYHIYVPCGICGETHEAVCPPERVRRRASGQPEAVRPTGRWRALQRPGSAGRAAGPGRRSERGCRLRRKP